MTLVAGDRITWTHPSGQHRTGVVWCQAPTPRRWSPEIDGTRPKGARLRAFWVTPDEPTGDEEAHTIMVRAAWTAAMTGPLLHESREDFECNSKHYQWSTQQSIREGAEFKATCRATQGLIRLPVWYRSYYLSGPYTT